METTPVLDVRQKRLVALIVVGATVGTLGVLYACLHRKIFPPANILYVDNAGKTTLTVKIDGREVDRVSARGSRGALLQRDLPDGKHVIEALDGTGVVAHHELELHGERCVVVVGGPEWIAVDVVPYGARDTDGESQPAAYLAKSNTEGTVWSVPMKSDVDEELDAPFPKSVRTQSSGVRRVRHLCRVIAGVPQCEGGPAEITSRERY